MQDGLGEGKPRQRAVGDCRLRFSGHEIGRFRRRDTSGQDQERPGTEQSAAMQLHITECPLAGPGARLKPGATKTEILGTASDKVGAAGLISRV